MEMLKLKEVFRTEKSFARFLYRALYFLEFCLVFLAWFLKRYPFPPMFFLSLSSLAIVGSFALYLCDWRRSGWSIEKIFAGVFALAFLILLPMSNYMDTTVDDLSMITLFLLSASVDKDDEHLMTAIFYFKLIVAILVLFAYNSHILSDMTMYRADKDLIRHSYGFMHPNSLGMYLVGLLFDFSLVKKARKARAGLVMLLVSLLIFAITDSRTTFLIAGVIILCYFFKPLLLNYRVSGYVIIPLVIVMFGLGLGLPYFYNDNSAIYATLNHLFSGRLNIGHTYLEYFKVDWLPRNIPTFTEINGHPMYDDSFYVDSLLRQGIFLFMLYPIFLIAQLRGKKLTLFHTLLFLITFFINIMEHYGASLCMCSVLLINYFAVSEDNPMEKY